MTEDRSIPDSLKKRLALYEEAGRLRSLGMSYLQIAKQLGVSVDAARAWSKGSRPKRVHRYEPDLTPSSDLAYVAGFYLGDGKYAGQEHKVRFELADQEQLEYVGALVAKILGRRPKHYGRDGTFYTVDYDSVVLSDFLNQDVNDLVDYLKDFPGDFLRGFFDAEGYVSFAVNHQTKRAQRVVVGVANTNLEYLRRVRSLLSNLGIYGNVRRTNKQGTRMTIRGKTWIRKRDVYHLVVCRNDMVVKFRDKIGFHNSIKAEKLQDLVGLLPETPSERYVWFMAHYRKEGHKWLRIRK
jgi:intein-encoded DNA endonuclease-like protein